MIAEMKLDYPYYFHSVVRYTSSIIVIGRVTYQATLAFFGLCHKLLSFTCSRIASQFIHLCVISMSSPCLDWAGPDT